MVLKVANYIKHADIVNPKILYKWDENDVTPIYMPADNDLVEILNKINPRAVCGLTIATAEWVVHRYYSMYNDEMPLQYLEAAWAGNVDLAYIRYIETDDDLWRGPVLGPINLAISIVIDVLFAEEDGMESPENASWIYNLANSVLPTTARFSEWHNNCVERLLKFYANYEENKDDWFGEDIDETIIPRDLFDPEFDYKPEIAESLMSDYLQYIENQENPFLRKTSEMVEIGFEGKPYNI